MEHLHNITLETIAAFVLLPAVLGAVISMAVETMRRSGRGMTTGQSLYSEDGDLS